MKKFLVNLSLACLILLFLLITLEGFLRVTHAFGARISWSDPDPLLGWRFRPNGAFTYIEENPKPVPFQTNRYGWKDREWKLEKEPGTFRVAVLGDSYVESLSVEDSKNFLRIVEQKLAAAGKKSEWMNFGRSGASQSEELLILKKDVLQFNPDLIVLFFFPVNDLDDLSPETSPDLIRPFFSINSENQLTLDTSFNQTPAFQAKKRISWLKQHSALISLFSQRFSLLTQQKRLKASQGKENSAEKLRGYLSLTTDKPNPVYEKNYRLSKRLIEEMAALVKTKGARFLLVSIDLPAYRPAVETSLRSVEASFDPLFYEKDLETFSKRTGIEYLGLQSLFREVYLKTGNPLHWQYWETDGREPYWEYGAHTGHWNEAGHETVAGALVEKLTLSSPHQTISAKS